MKALIVDTSEPSDSRHNAPLIRQVSLLVDTEVVNYRNLPTLAIHEGAYSAVIVSGVPLHYSFSTIDDRGRYIKRLLSEEIPMLGICLGHQAIGRLFGSKLMKGTEAEHGIHSVIVENNDPIFSGLGAGFDVPTRHRGSISLPRDFVQLARSRSCKNVIMRHSTRLIYGFQFHPESSPAGMILFRNFFDTAEKYKADASATTPPADILPLPAVS